MKKLAAVRITAERVNYVRKEYFTSHLFIYSFGRIFISIKFTT
jgi:hypothetical protein